MPGITRSCDLQPVSVLSMDCLPMVLASGQGSTAADRVFVTDLTYGGWRPHQAAQELFHSAGLVFPEPPQASPSGSGAGVLDGLFSYARLIGQGIDAEARGNGTVQSALQLATTFACRINQSRPALIIVIAPRFGFGLGADNRWFLHFLAQAFRHGPHRIAVVRGQSLPVDLPSTWKLDEAHVTAPAASGPDAANGLPLLLRLVPGTISAELLSMLGADAAERCLIPQNSGDFIVAPLSRVAPTGLSPFNFDELAAQAEAVPWLRCYAQLHGNNYFVDPDFLAFHAWQFFAQGGHEIALRLLQRAVSCARNLQIRNGVEAQLQGMRIAMHRFAEAAEAKPPSGGDPSIRNFLLKAKGWALVMSGNAAAGRTYLKEARSYSEIAAPGSIEDLYLRNILALSEARTGETSEALRLEQEITAANGRSDPFDWRLHYVNMINTARLLRVAGREEEAHEAYKEAFTTGDGNLSESDRVYDEACLARLATETGRHPDAMRHWFRAALGFAASAVPEALSARCATLLLARRIDSSDEVTEEVAGILRGALLAAKARLPPEHIWSGIEPSSLEGETAAPTFLYSGAGVPQLLAEAFGAVGSDGWSVIPVLANAAPAYDGPAHRALRRLLAGLIRHAAASRACEAAATYVIDERQGRVIASSEQEQIESCVDLGLRRSVFRGKVVEMTPSCLETLGQASRLRLGNLVRKVEMAGRRARVIYKRYIPDRWEDDAYGLIEAAATGHQTLGVVAGLAGRDALDKLRARARELADRRVICLELPPCWPRLLSEDHP